MDKDLRKQILNEIKVNDAEHSKRLDIVNDFINKLKNSAKKLKYDCKFFIGGSFGKGTYLKNSSDVDIFTRFDVKYEDNKISSYLKEILEYANIKFAKQKGSRDYYSYDFIDAKSKLKLKFEIVPNRYIKDIKDVKNIVNSTDVSPLHVSFLKSKIKNNPNLQDEIRLTKQFFKSKKLYGAESYINGFSGHVIDILIAYYGSLEDLLIAGKNWENETFVDINKSYKNKEEALNILNSSKYSKLILIDPIIRERNAAKALSDDNYARFLLIAQSFDELRREDFKIINFNLSKTISGVKQFAKLNNLKYCCYTFKVELDDTTQDIAGSKLLKINSKFQKYFESFDFDVFKNDFFIDLNQEVCLFTFLFEKIELSSLKKIQGPFAYMTDDVLKFLSNKDYYFVENSRIWAYEKRDFTKVDDILKIDIEDCKKMLAKDISFIKSIKITKI